MRQHHKQTLSDAEALRRAFKPEPMVITDEVVWRKLNNLPNIEKLVQKFRR